jgi:hypothetical protein
VKHTIDCLAFKPLSKNTLRGFAKIRVRELHLVVNDVTLHEKGGNRWAGLPGRPQVRDGAVVTDDNGKTAYAPVLEFESRAASDAFSDAVWRAVEAMASLEEAAPRLPLEKPNAGRSRPRCSCPIPASPATRRSGRRSTTASRTRVPQTRDLQRCGRAAQAF